MINRQTPPPFKTISNIIIPQAGEQTLSNGIPVYSISAGSQAITKLEFIFKAGMYHQPETLVASAANNLLESGTRSFTANQISDGIDYYGSFLELQVEQDYATVTLYSLNRFLPESLKFVEEVIKYPNFPEDEFKIYISNKRQKHAINSQKVSVLVRRRFTEVLFGEQHPYGKNVSDADFDRISVADIKAFFTHKYGWNNCTIMASGLLPENLTTLLENSFGQEEWGKVAASPIERYIAPTPVAGDKFRIEKEDAIQTAIRVGRVLFNKRHEDYFHFQVLNTVLGGYFGSRLMTNIREDKGYTYGIGSGLNNLVHAGYFFISTEVGAEVTNATLEEIYKEIQDLRENLVDDEELETVRNYMLGHFLRTVDGPFSLAQKFRSIWEFGLGYDYYENYFKAVKTVKADRLRELANKYLQQDSLIECIAGKF